MSARIRPAHTHFSSTKPGHNRIADMRLNRARLRSSSSGETNSIGNVKTSPSGASPWTTRRTPAAVLIPDQVNVTRAPLSRLLKSTSALLTSRD